MGMYLDLWDVSDGHPKAREELAELRLAQERYEKVRKMTAARFGDIWIRNLRTGKPFDDLVDEFEIETR